MAEIGVDYTILQKVLDQQGYIVVVSQSGYEIPTGSVVNGENILVMDARCKGAKMVCIGAATFDEWLDQGHKYYPKGRDDPDAGSTFFKLVAE